MALSSTYLCETKEISNSSQLKRYAYNSDTGILLVEFISGGLYLYLDVSPDTMDKFREAESKGSFFHNEIKSRCKCVNLTFLLDWFFPSVAI